jgi:NitT/TauT family transport system substrate-binding protein
MAGQPKPAFYVAVGAVVIGLIALAVFNWKHIAPHSSERVGTIDTSKVMPTPVEQPGGEGVELHAKEYKYVPAEKLPDIKAPSDYKKLDENNTIHFAINVWAGWGPIVLANNGTKPEKDWTTPGGKKFRVALDVIDNPVQMRDAYIAGDAHIGWATVDMIPLFMERFVDKSGKPRDTRIMPRVYQQIDWSNGGDGIVARENIKTVADLRGKRIVLAQNSPSHYFALNILVYGGVQPSEVKMDFTSDAFEAARAFNTDKNLSAAVSWSPDIGNLAKVRGNRMLVTTSEASKLIADVWFARADFAKDNPDIIEGLVRGIFDAMAEMKTDDGRKKAAELMAKAYSVPPSEATDMLGDAHNTNWAENYQFFVNQNNPTNFEQIWNRAYYLYKRIGTITHQPVPFDQVMDFSVVQKLGQEDKYKSQQDEYHSKFVQKTPTEIKGAEQEILTNTVQIRFAPNNWDVHHKVVREVDGKSVESLYDPNVDNVLDEIAKLAGQFGNAHIIIEGHTDSSMKGQVTADLVKELSQKRADAVKEAVLQRHPDLDTKRFAVDGLGWERPADPNDPNNNAKNRRVEVKVYTAEKPG